MSCLSAVHTNAEPNHYRFSSYRNKTDGLIKTDGKGVYMVRKLDELKTDLQRELFEQYQIKCKQWEEDNK